MNGNHFNSRNDRRHSISFLPHKSLLSKIEDPILSHDQIDALPPPFPNEATVTDQRYDEIDGLTGLKHSADGRSLQSLALRREG